MLVRADNSVVFVVDIQDKLLPVVHDNASLLKNVVLLLETASTLSIPQLVSEQYPQGLGETVAGVKRVVTQGGLQGAGFLEKVCFSAVRADRFDEALAPYDDRRQAVVVGIEAHICVLQTALDLRVRGFEVFVVADGVSSRRESDRDKALARLRDNGCHIVTTEMVLFEWLGKAGTPLFKQVSKAIR